MPPSTASRPAIHVGPYTFTETDARRTFHLLGELWRMHVHDLDAVPPAAVAAAVAIGARLAETTGLPGPHHAEAHPDPGPLLDAAGAAADRAVAGGTWPHAEIEIELEAAWLGFRAVADALRGAGVYDGPVDGVVEQLNVSSGGVPKRPVESVEVDWSGVAGDVQTARQHHGRPWQALCLWSAEVIDAFAADGHPLGYGSAGENVTIRGIDWSLVRPGSHLRIGTVVCEVSAYALPCSKNARWFRDGEFTAMHHDRGPVSRVYATVTRPGTVRAGDTVTLEPVS